MTPTEQDKELREKLTKLISQDGWVDTQEVDADGQVNELVAIITADRERVALEARLDENNMYIRELVIFFSIINTIWIRNLKSAILC